MSWAWGTLNPHWVPDLREFTKHRLEMPDWEGAQDWAAYCGFVLHDTGDGRIGRHTRWCHAKALANDPCDDWSELLYEQELARVTAQVRALDDI